MRNASGGRWRLSSRGTPGVERASVRAAVLTPNRAAVLVIVVVVLTANALVLVGGFDPNPMGTRSELASSLTAGALPGETTIDPNDGFISQALGHRAALDVLHLRMPWWDSEEGTGAPLAAGMTSGALYPPTLLNAFANGLIYERVLLELVAGLSLFFLLRRLALARAACMAAAIAFALDGTFAWFAITPINPIPLLPVLLLGLEAAYTRSVARARGGWWLIAVAGALSLYAGFPEVAYIDGLLAVGWFAWRAAGLRGGARRAFAAKAAAGTGAAVLLSAPLLVPFAEYLGRGALGGHVDGVVGRVHLATPALSQLLLPYIYGPIFAFGDTGLTLTTIWFDVGGFLSASLLFFGLLGVLGPGRRGLKLVLLGWIVVALTRVYREPPLLGDVLGVLPGMSRMAFFRYAFPSALGSSRSLFSPRSGAGRGSRARLRRGDASRPRPGSRSLSSLPPPSRRARSRTVSAAASTTIRTSGGRSAGGSPSCWRERRPRSRNRGASASRSPRCSSPATRSSSSRSRKPPLAATSGSTSRRFGTCSSISAPNASSRSGRFSPTTARTSGSPS